MPLDPRAKRFLDTLAAMNPANALSQTVEERRGAVAQLLSFSGAAETVGAITTQAMPGPQGPLQLRLYTPAGLSAKDLLPGLIYFHGGGLVAGSLDTHDPICRSLANASLCRVVSVDYRLAPEHPFPAAVADGCAATTWAPAHAGELAIDPQRLGLSGDSAGATLAAVVCQQVSASRQVRLAFQFPLCPIMDFSSGGDSRRALGRGYLVDRDTCDHDLKPDLPPGIDGANPQVSRLRAAEIRDLPPTAIHTAEFDPLRDEGQAYPTN